MAGLQATLNDAADPSADMVLTYRELPWRHGQQLLQVASAELPVLRLVQGPPQLVLSSKGLMWLPASAV